MAPPDRLPLATTLSGMTMACREMLDDQGEGSRQPLRLPIGDTLLAFMHAITSLGGCTLHSHCTD